MTSFVTAVCLVSALFIAPLILSVPSVATAPVLILVGIMMMYDIRNVQFDLFLDAIPCSICIIIMPLTYSISDGIMLGQISYVLIRICTGKWKELNLGMVVLAAAFLLKYTFL